MQKQIVLGECEVSTGCSMREYEQQTIEEVVASAKHGNDEAMEYVLAKYKGLVRRLSRTLFLLDGDEDDLIQEGMIGLYKAVVSYDECRGAAFETFASHCINRQMYSAVKKSNRKKTGLLILIFQLIQPVIAIMNRDWTASSCWIVCRQVCIKIQRTLLLTEKKPVI